MKSILDPKLGLLVLALAVCGLTLAGCSTTSKPRCCPTLEGHCCGWDFYKPCDMIEGRAEREGRNICGDPCSACKICGCRPGIPVGATQVVPAARKPAEEDVEKPADEAVEEAPAEDSVAEFGLPPGR